jgi:tRNA(adenine34) deaminase
MDPDIAHDIDIAMMRRCIERSRMATLEGEFPFASVIGRGGEIVAEATNRVVRDADVTRHAELLAISAAQRSLGRGRLTGCTIYANVEPCAMCSFPIRESRIDRVVFAIASPLMGGHSKWGILTDREMSTVMPEAFAAPPAVVTGLLRTEAEKVWRNWNPLIWGIIKWRGCFDIPRGHGVAHAHSPCEGEGDAKPAPRRWRGLLTQR